MRISKFLVGYFFNGLVLGIEVYMFNVENIDILLIFHLDNYVMRAVFIVDSIISFIKT